MPTNPPPPPYPRWIVVLIAAAIVLHLNYWLWDDDGLVLGMPVNMLYHVLLSLLLSATMFVLVSKAWPSFLDDEDQE